MTLAALPRRLRACMVAPTKIIAGLGMSLGIDVAEVEGATGDYRTLFHRKAEFIAQALTAGAARWVVCVLCVYCGD